MPQVVNTQRPLVFWAISAALVLSLVSLIVIAPIAAASGHGEVAAGIYRGFSVLCHQLPERSYFIDGHKFGVCSRCTGIYAGFAFTLLLYPLVRSLRTTTTPARKWLLMAAAPLAIDFSLTFLGIWENTHTSRLLTGLLLGSVAVFYVMPGIMELSLRGLRPAAPVRSTVIHGFPDRITTAPSDYSAPERRI
jgi:uncharacterized membrane protein